ncbi:GNAT family N-acetyltransferase [Micromonospora robiginosa]|uniref:GNAT family N-acetyltransferase n=1 Tax=Micromonospora robiginosa TaxID=2749844 RepID=A0A7L6BEW0_9ACTN|nr:GNAT family N-acetyltransferase [Micromonospora ferruginea]QLQ40371.2 GNAT family N-acetyltransferase [Micromonospora ferruginea]
MTDVRHATSGDVAAVAEMAGQLAQSFPFSRTRFDASCAALLDSDAACLLLAVDGDAALGYLLGVDHLTFYANGPVAVVEEILVRPEVRGRGIGRALMAAFERWAVSRNCGLVTLATRRAAPFYAALGYEESAVHLRKVLREPAAP